MSGGNVGAAPHVGEIERDEAVVDEVVQPHRTALRPVQDGVGNAVADAERPAVGLHHGPVAGLVDAKPHAQHGAGRGIGPGRARHRLYRVGLPRHVFARGFRHLAGALGRDRPLLARIAVEQGIARPAARHPGQPPGQADRIENAGVEAERPHRRDQMRGVAHQEHAIPPPLRRDAVVDAVDDGVEDFHLVDRTDETQHLVAEFLRASAPEPRRPADRGSASSAAGAPGSSIPAGRRNRRDTDSRADWPRRDRPSRRPAGNARRTIRLRRRRRAARAPCCARRRRPADRSPRRHGCRRASRSSRPRRRRSVETTSGDAADGAHRAGADRWHRCRIGSR